VPTYSVVAQSPSGLRVPLTLSIVREFPAAKIGDEVIQPLANEGAEVSCQVVILAKGEAAIRENTVELGIKESLSQRDIEADIKTG
jgi:hypothetical protein